MQEVADSPSATMNLLSMPVYLGFKVAKRVFFWPGQQNHSQSGSALKSGCWQCREITPTEFYAGRHFPSRMNVSFFCFFQCSFEVK
jgi:hypothetical protein